MRRSHPLLSLLLAVCLIAGAFSTAVARGRMLSVSEIVICSGYGVVTLRVDADGKPVNAVHPCPDCLAAQGAALIPETPSVMAPTQSRRCAALPRAADPLGADCPTASARGPPMVA